MKKYLVLIIALVIGTFLRLWMLSSVPNGLTWDEAGIGYNAYSILKTGRDEHGVFLPIVFKSFGDYKPGAYIYLTVPSVAIFGLNEFAVRFPSALAGIFAIIGIYLLTKEIFSSKFHPAKLFGLEVFPWDFSALAFSISPWSIHFSHGAWEVNVFTTLTIFTLYFFLRFIKEKSSIFPALFLACLSLAMYQAAKLLTPLTILLLIAIYWHDFWKQFPKLFKRRTLPLLIPFIVFGFYIVFGSMFGRAGNRLNTLSIFNYKPDLVKQVTQIDGQGSWSISAFHNQPQLTAYLVLNRYLYHFSPEVLLYEGSLFSERGHIPGLGILNPLDFIWLLFGFIFISRNWHKTTQTIIGLLLISPIPASLTLAEFSTYRALPMVAPLAIISGIGLYYLFSKSKIVFTLIITLYLLCTFYVFDVYFFHSQNVFAKEFNYGYKQAVELIKENPTSKVVFTDVLGQPYIYYVFYTAYDPATYQKNIDFIDGGLDVGRVGHVGNVEFHQFGSDEMNTQKDVMFIGSEGNINNQYDITGPNVDLFKQIETPDRHIIFRVIKTKS